MALRPHILTLSVDALCVRKLTVSITKGCAGNGGYAPISPGAYYA